MSSTNRDFLLSVAEIPKFLKSNFNLTLERLFIFQRAPREFGNTSENFIFYFFHFDKTGFFSTLFISFPNSFLNYDLVLINCMCFFRTYIIRKRLTNEYLDEIQKNSALATGPNYYQWLYKHNKEYRNSVNIIIEHRMATMGLGSIR